MRKYTAEESFSAVYFYVILDNNHAILSPLVNLPFRETMTGQNFLGMITNSLRSMAFKFG